MGNKYVDNAYRDIVYKHPRWEDTAREYEKGFAKALEEETFVKEATRGALTKLSNMLNSYYGVRRFQEEHPEECKKGDFSALYDFAGGREEGNVAVGEVLEESFLSAGLEAPFRNRAILPDGEEWENEEEEAAAHLGNQRMLDSLINGDGKNHLEMQMRLLSAGFIQSGGDTQEEIDGIRSYKQMMTRLTPGDRRLMELSGYSFGKEKPVKKRGNFVSRFLAGIGRTLKSAFSGKKPEQDSRKETESRIYGLTPENVELLYRQAEGVQKTEEGQNGRTTAEGMLQKAGVNGTVMRMLAAYRMIGAGKSELLYFRLALIGWLCSKGDVSLYEVLNSSRLAGVTGYEDLSDAVAMYRSVDPLSPEEIRMYAPKGEFPQETIYKLMVREAGLTRKKRIDQKNEKLREENAGYDVEKVYAEIEQLEGEIAKKEEELEKHLADAGIGEDRMEKLLAADEASLSPLEKAIRDTYTKMEEKISELEDEREAKKKETLSKGFDRWYDFSNANLFENSVFGISEDVEKDEKGVEIPKELHTLDLDANELALNIYTTSAFKIMNESQKYGEGLIRQKYRHRKLLGKLFHVNTDASFREATEEELDDEGLVDQVFEVLRLSNRIVQDALDENAALGLDGEPEETAEMSDGEQETEKKNGTDITYRGGKSASEFSSQGAVYETKSLTSTSRASCVAENFYNQSTTGYMDVPFKDYSDGIYDKCSIVEFHIDKRSGRYVDEISQYRGEKELLLPAGVRFKVAKPLREMFYDPGEKKLKEIGNREEAEKIRRGEEPSPGYAKYRLRKVATLELDSNRQTKFTSKRYLEKRRKREKKQLELLERAEAYKALKAQ